ncbi:DNA-binding domain-containing protein [Marinobacterium aestuariivivens]|uniref:DNA-binding domain-containing protein n=1 Tax=Marinobacterium aestuariivivens TaxID=1698799 RepID=A0ABW2A5V1_9GAMM
MSALNRLQRAFAEDLWGSDLKHLQGLIPDGRLPAARLLQVYRNNFRISLTEALEAVYPVMQRLVGADFFATWSTGTCATIPRLRRPHSVRRPDGGLCCRFPASGQPALPCRHRPSGMGLP